ncbi:MAG: ribulose-phosphate 3-epimerase [Sedimentisphaerales bacterium]|nr:ribulose-phosphate 3-epimerase [Sedimentisphaerales bacterium]
MAAGTLFKQIKAIAPTISVGVMTADWMNLGADLALMEQAGVTLLHFDVMDGCFCPMMTLGPPVIKAIKTPLLKDVHLMIDEPLDKLEQYIKAGADIVSVPVESRHIHRSLQMLAAMENVNDPARGILRGLVLNPGTFIESIIPLLDEVDMVTLLAVNPGWGGQGFFPATRYKLQQLKAIFNAAQRDILICLDGGITRNNIADIAALGPDVIVTGSAVFDGKAPLENARFMLEILQNL